ncbi:MAG: DUF1667 domain-containing protein [Clostridia bacterium]|nr:DUF1667 domain-containing protein [Clostridia bacterium]
MQKNIICVACPMGCGVTVDIDDNGEILSVTGNTCKRGDAYARTECTNPVRSLATTVKVDGGIYNVVPCKSAGAIPKEKIMECMNIINNASANAPVNLGDVLIKDILGTGIDIVATNHCPAK